MLDRRQQIVGQDHAHPEAIGLIDKFGNAKSGLTLQASLGSGVAAQKRSITVWWEL